MRLVEEALFLWRDAEQVLADMPPMHPERTEVVWIAHQLRSMTSQFSRVAGSRSSAVAHRHSLEELRNQLARFQLNGGPAPARESSPGESPLTAPTSAGAPQASAS